ncbi:S-adenosyl-L-methionine-dependent methyltransferase [Hesseltinella vesiculosa]|uniref:S-adenosyl-L-methionine-dependent methyltransferase n=1 Tax=Hesseltinella vesiculosa TaxID=101127 RepID=A0A1X2GQR7_9FUNG|nr:S-adenosyl-L-methionine-dependent methyltransferase [Hesseltinella vesiculosa]
MKKQTSSRLFWIPVCLGLTHWTLQAKLLQPFLIQYRWAHALLFSLIGTLLSMCVAWDQVKTPLMFMYSCFFKPLGKHDNHQSRLESFYQDQASIYDRTRDSLLRGRRTMLKLSAAHLKSQLANGTYGNRKPIWIDLGGGTGWNIEQMNKSLPIDQFEHVYLVDLTPSLCKIAEERFKRNGWTNVTVLCQDASTFQADVPLDGRVQLVTMSYSLSMMDGYFAVVDRVQSLLCADGVVGVCDFYVSGRTSPASERGLAHLRRQCHWLTRYFWQMWFEFDHIHLAPGRRDYLEYKFGTVKSLNRRNHFIVPYLVQIPYYIWLGSAVKNTLASSTAVIDDDIDSLASNQSSPKLAPSTFSALTVAQKNKQWRLDYQPDLPCHTQFRSYIYAFTWEDPRVDLSYLNLSSDDVMFVITSAGDNALEYALHKPKRIHCIDLNPCQNHLLELKLASIASLPYEDVWRMFGDGRHPHFQSLLHETLSPNLSTYAFQYWSQHSDRFSHKFYKTGYSGLALNIFEWWVRMNGLSGQVEAMCHAKTIEEQKAIWLEKIRPCIFSPMIRKILNNPMFMWNALGVPMNQMNMFLQECTTQQYIEDTLDPIPGHSLLSQDQYFYYLCMMQHYHRDSCPSYLTKDGFEKLKTALDVFRLHTDSILNVLQSLPDNYLTRMVVMDHMDWFDPESHDELDDEIKQMARACQVGGQVYWRSAGCVPWYNRLFEKHGFKVEALAIRKSGQAIDRVNMYASFYRGIKL